MATQVLLPLIASLMFLVGIWLAFVEIRNWWKAQTEGWHSAKAMANILNLDRRARLLLVCLKEFRSTPNRCGWRRPLPDGHARTDRFPGKGVTNPLGRLLIDYFLRTQFSTTTKNHVRALPHVYTNLNGCFPAEACADNGCSQLPVYANQNGLERMHPLQFRFVGKRELDQPDDFKFARFQGVSPALADGVG